MRLSIAIAKTASQNPRGKKPGDIVAVRLAGWKWGTKELENYNIIELDVPEHSHINQAREEFEVSIIENEMEMRMNPQAVEMVAEKFRFRLQGNKIFDKKLGRFR